MSATGWFWKSEPPGLDPLVPTTTAMDQVFVLSKPGTTALIGLVGTTADTYLPTDKVIILVNE